MSTMLKPMEVPPSWYCDYKLPTNLLGSFTPLIYLTGLDLQTNQTHRGFWEILNLKNPTKEFQPTYINVSIDHKFREKKVKVEMIEYYIPRGILKSNWIHKHTEEIPSAVVAFFDMNWSDPQWNQRKLELAKKIKDLKTSLGPHGTQVLVMLIKPSGVVEDNFSTERASAFCAAAEIPPKYLFVLAHSNSERIQACIQRLEMGMRELAKSYYSARIKKVKAWKDKITITPMLVRYNFKIAVLQEIRRDHIAALNHYQTANEALLSIKATDANVQELKVVASILSYRMSRIYLTKMDGKDSKNVFDKHIRSFQKLIGNPELLFEHFAWLSQQYYQYGELLKQFYRRGSISGIPDPVPYFITAGKYVEKRRKDFLERVKPQGKVVWPAEMNPYNGEAKLSCLGQRPWWNNPFSQDYLYAVEDTNSIKALKYFESLCKHTDYIISDWGIASDFCREEQRMRSRCQLMSMMGGEFYKSKEYGKCIMLMTHILREFGHEDWNTIVYDVADVGLRAACCEGDIPAYCNFLMILLKLDITDLVTSERQHLLWSKFQAVINNQIPQPEENCEMNPVRWEKSLSEPAWTSYVEVHSKPILDCQVQFLADVVHLSEEPTIRFILKNQSQFPITVRKYGVRTSMVEYNCEATINALLQTHEVRELELAFKPLLRDLNKPVQIQVAFVDIGKENRSVLLHFSFLRPSSPYLWPNESKDTTRVGQSVLRIEPSKPLLEIRTTRLDRVLVDEWYKIVVSLINTDVLDYGKISFACQLQTVDPLKAILTTDPKTTRYPGTLTQTFEIQGLAHSSTHDTVLYLKTFNKAETEVKFVVKVSYLDTHSQSMTVEHAEPLNALNPFEVTQNVLDLQKSPLSDVHVDETFVAQFLIRNISTATLRITDCSLNIASPSFDMKQQNEKQCSDLVLNEDEEATCMFLLSAAATESDSLGNLEINWKREANEDGLQVQTQVPVNPIPSKDDNALFLHGVFSNNGHGKLKEPMRAYYTLINRTTRVYELSIVIDSSESFMNAGPKKISLKLHGMDSYKFGYILFPLVTGLVDAPNLSIVTPANGTTVLDPIPLMFRQNSAKTLYITA